MQRVRVAEVRIGVGVCKKDGHHLRNNKSKGNVDVAVRGIGQGQKQTDKGKRGSSCGKQKVEGCEQLRV